MPSIEEQLKSFADHKVTDRKAAEDAGVITVAPLEGRRSRRPQIFLGAAAAAALVGAFLIPRLVQTDRSVEISPTQTTTAPTTTESTPPTSAGELNRTNQSLAAEELFVLPRSDWELTSYSEPTPDPSNVQPPKRLLEFDVGAGSTLFLRVSTNTAGGPARSDAELQSEYNRSYFSWNEGEHQLDLIGFDVAEAQMRIWAQGVIADDDGFRIPDLDVKYTGSSTELDFGQTSLEYQPTQGQSRQTVLQHNRADNWAGLLAELGEASGGGFTEPITVAGHRGFAVSGGEFSYALVLVENPAGTAVMQWQSPETNDLRPFLSLLDTVQPPEWNDAVAEAPATQTEAATAETADIELGSDPTNRLPRFLPELDGWTLLNGHDRSLWTEDKLRQSIAGARAQLERSPAQLVDVQLLRRNDRLTAIAPDVLIQTWLWKPEHVRQLGKLRPNEAGPAAVGNFDGWIDTESGINADVSTVRGFDGLVEVAVFGGSLPIEEVKALAAQLEIRTTGNGNGDDRVPTARYSGTEFTASYGGPDVPFREGSMTWATIYERPDNKGSNGHDRFTVFAQELQDPVYREVSLARDSNLRNVTVEHRGTFRGYPVLIETMPVRGQGEDGPWEDEMVSARVDILDAGYTLEVRIDFDNNPQEILPLLRQVELDEWWDTTEGNLRRWTAVVHAPTWLGDDQTRHICVITSVSCSNGCTLGAL